MPANDAFCGPYKKDMEADALEGGAKIPLSFTIWYAVTKRPNAIRWAERGGEGIPALARWLDSSTAKHFGHLEPVGISSRRNGDISTKVGS